MSHSFSVLQPEQAVFPSRVHHPLAPILNAVFTRRYPRTPRWPLIHSLWSSLRRTLASRHLPHPFTVGIRFDILVRVPVLLDQPHPMPIRKESNAADIEFNPRFGNNIDFQRKFPTTRIRRNKNRAFPAFPCKPSSGTAFHLHRIGPYDRTRFHPAGRPCPPISPSLRNTSL